MKTKSRKVPYKPILQDCELVEVTDPDEFAELERRVRAAQKAMAQRSKEPRKRKPRPVKP